METWKILEEISKNWKISPGKFQNSNISKGNWNPRKFCWNIRIHCGILVNWKILLFQYYLITIFSGNIGIVEYWNTGKFYYSNISRKNIGILESWKIPIFQLEKFQYFNMSRGNIGILESSKIPIF